MDGKTQRVPRACWTVMFVVALMGAALSAVTGVRGILAPPTVTGGDWPVAEREQGERYDDLLQDDDYEDRDENSEDYDDGDEEGYDESPEDTYDTLSGVLAAEEEREASPPDGNGPRALTTEGVDATTLGRDPAGRLAELREALRRRREGSGPEPEPEDTAEEPIGDVAPEASPTAESPGRPLTTEGVDPDEPLVDATLRGVREALERRREADAPALPAAEEQEASAGESPHEGWEEPAPVTAEQIERLRDLLEQENEASPRDLLPEEVSVDLSALDADAPEAEPSGAAGPLFTVTYAWDHEPRIWAARALRLLLALLLIFVGWRESKLRYGAAGAALGVTVLLGTLGTLAEGHEAGLWIYAVLSPMGQLWSLAFALIALGARKGGRRLAFAIIGLHFAVVVVWNIARLADLTLGPALLVIQYTVIVLSWLVIAAVFRQAASAAAPTSVALGGDPYRSAAAPPSLPLDGPAVDEALTPFAAWGSVQLLAWLLPWLRLFESEPVASFVFAADVGLLTLIAGHARSASGPRERRAWRFLVRGLAALVGLSLVAFASSFLEVQASHLVRDTLITGSRVAAAVASGVAGWLFAQALRASVSARLRADESSREPPPHLIVFACIGLGALRFLVSAPRADARILVTLLALFVGVGGFGAFRYVASLGPRAAQTTQSDEEE